MLNIVKVLISLAGEHKLKLSMTQIEHLTAQLITVLIIGMFLTTLAAIAVAASVFGLYQVLIVAGLSALMSILIVGFALLAIIGICVNRLSHYMILIRAGLKSVAHFETPVVGQVVNQVSNVAQSFISGLMQPQTGKKLQTPPEPERTRISLVRTRSL